MAIKISDGNNLTGIDFIDSTVVDYQSLSAGVLPGNDGNGNWLDSRIGGVAAPVAFTPALQQQYASVFSPSFSQDTRVSLPGVSQSSVAWGDYNNDQKLDFLLTGFNGSEGITQLYKNTDIGFIEDTSVSLPGVSVSSVAWADYNNDQKLDFLLTGFNGSEGLISQLYKNTDSGFIADTSVSLPAVELSSVAWADYNNDGKIDFLLTGFNGSEEPITQLYKNTGSGFAEDTSVSLPGVGSSSVAWGDYNNDQKLDFLLTGRTDSRELIRV